MANPSAGHPKRGVGKTAGAHKRAGASRPQPRERQGRSQGGSRPTSPVRSASRAPHGVRESARPARPGNFIEGRRAAAEALRTGFPVRRVLVSEGSNKDVNLVRLAEAFQQLSVPVSRVPRAQLEELSSHGAHQGIVLEAGSFPYADIADIIARAGEGPALVLVLDHVTDAGNFGAIVRSAEVVGAAGVVIANKRAAEVTVATYKTSAGAVMHLPIAQVPNIARALDDLKEAGFWVGGASEHAEDVCWSSPFEGRIALVMGSEGEGISRLVLDKCDFLTKLPQLGQTESLNVAQACTSLCFEWLRRNFGAVRGRMVEGA